MAIRIEWETRGVLVHFEDEVDFSQVTDYQKDFYEDPRSDRCRYAIFDCRYLRSFNLTEEDLGNISVLTASGAALVSGLKQVFVANQEATIRSLEQYIELCQSLETPRSFQIFSDMESARAWVERAPAPQ